MIFTPGIHYGVPFAEYLAITAVSATALKAGRRSMLHLRHVLTTPSEPSNAMTLGTLTHCLALEPAKFAEKFYVMPDVDGRTKAGKEANAKAESESGGREVVRESTLEAAKTMVAAMNRHPQVSRWLAAKGECEAVALWVDPETGLHCKARFDKFCAEQIALDIKTARNGSAHAFTRACGDLGYAQQLAHYEEGFRVLSGKHTPLCLAVVENEPPYVVAAYSLSQRSIDGAANLNRRIRHALAHAQRTGAWDGYSEHVVEIEVPDWALSPSGALPSELDNDHGF